MVVELVGQFLQVGIQPGAQIVHHVLRNALHNQAAAVIGHGAQKHHAHQHSRQRNQPRHIAVWYNLVYDVLSDVRSKQQRDDYYQLQEQSQVHPFLVNLD